MRMRLLNIGTTSQQRSLSQGLIAYWKLDEVDGSALDSVGIYNGAISYDISQNTTGKINNAYIFNGSEGLLSFPVISLGTTFSISAWIKKDGTGDNYGMCFGDTTGDQGLYIGNSGKFDYWYNSASHVTVNNVFDNLTWSHFVISVSSGTGEGYVNCNKVIDLTSIPAFDFQCFGHYSPDSSDWFNFVWKGALDEVGIWNRLLTINDISTLYNLGVGRSYPFNKRIITDNFNSYSIGSLEGQGNWISALPNPQLMVVDYSGNNRIQCLASVSKDCIFYKDISMNPDQSSQIEFFGTGTTDYDDTGVAVRVTPGNGYFYWAGVQERGLDVFIDNALIRLTAATNIGLTTGDIMKISVVGTTITCYLNGEVDTGLNIAISPATGGSGVYTDIRLTTGEPGFYGFGYYDETSVQGDNWMAWEI